MDTASVKEREYELSPHPFHRVPLKTWNSIGTMVWEFLIRNTQKNWNGWNKTKRVLEIQKFDFNRIHKKLCFRIKFTDAVEDFGYIVSAFLDLLCAAYTPGSTIEKYFSEHIFMRSSKRRAAVFEAIDSAFWYKTTWNEPQKEKAETTYSFVGNSHVDALKSSFAKTNWITTKQLRNFILDFDRDRYERLERNERLRLKSFNADNYKWKMYQLWGHLDYIRGVVKDMKGVSCLTI